MKPTLKKVLVCGHRGASGYAPENTFAAFYKALEQGADWLEFDVQLSADGVPVIFHDDFLDRTSDHGGGRRPVELTLAELKALDAGAWFGQEFAGTRIPTLDETLEEFGDKLGLNIEIKSKPHFETGNKIEQKVAEAISRHNLYETTLVSSFDPFRLASLHACDPKIKIAALHTDQTEDYPPNFDFFQLPSMTGAKALHPPYSLVNELYLEKAWKLGLEVNTWTVNDAATMYSLVQLGVNMIITNYPDRLKNITG